jgi:glycosyltransferase involved in cell wall biosynthesis
MKVLHVDSARGWRGGQNQVLLAAREMARRGHEPVVACRAGGALEARARAASLRVLPLTFHGDLSLAAALRLARLLRRERYDAAQLHDPHAVAAGVAAARLAGFRATLGTRRVDFPLQGPASRRKYRACARVVAVSRAIASVLEAGGVAPERVRVVYEGVPDRPPQAGGRAALAALGVAPEAPVIGNVAALTDHKDQATLLEAAARVFAARPEARLVIAGEGELRGALEQRARHPDLAGRVVFAGFRDDLDRLLPAFDVFCLSSHMEGLGTSLLDAMCFARPIVATAAGGIPEALAGALLELLTDTRRAATLGAAGRARFQAGFSVERMVDATLAAYAEAVA